MAQTKPLTLSATASAMRKLLLATGITLAFLIVGRIFFQSAYAYWQSLHPTPPPPPTVGFGILPKIAFPPSLHVPTTYVLQVSSLKMKNFPDRALVFFQPSLRANLLAVDKASKQASSLGFLFQPDRVSSEQYRWRRTQPLPSVLDYNIITGTFRIRVDWQSNPSYLQGNKLPSEDQAISIVRQSLSNAGILQKDMATGSAKVTYLRSSADSYANTVSFSEADFLQVDLFRTSVRDQYPIVTERPNKGTIRAIISGNEEKGQQIVALEYNYLPVDYNSLHTYPIISATQAYQLLTTNKGYIASSPTDQQEAIIRSVSLGYFDSGTNAQNYLQPIYVFEGDGGFVGYVSAVTPKWVAQ